MFSLTDKKMQNISHLETAYPMAIKFLSRQAQAVALLIDQVLPYRQLLTAVLAEKI